MGPLRRKFNVYMFRDLLNLLKPSPLIPTDERREKIRLQCDLHALLRRGEDFSFVRVVNVTLTGLCLELDDSLKVGEPVSLSRDEFGPPLDADVLWCEASTPGSEGRGYRAGLGFQADYHRLRLSWLKPSLKQAGFEAELPGQLRKLLRVPGRVDCQLKGLTGEAYTDAEMLDLSLGGALVESPMEFPENLSVEFETSPLGGLPPLKGLAKIASRQRSEDGKWRCGLRFTESKPDDIRKYMGSMLASQ